MSPKDPLMRPNRPNITEQATVLALVRATKHDWHRTAVMIEEAGSAMKLLARNWTGLEPFEVQAAEALASRVSPGDVAKYIVLIEQLERSGVKVITILDA